MLRKLNIRKYFFYSLMAAVLYCIPVLIFIIHATYTDAWLLYLGNFLFMGAITYFMLTFNRKREDNASSTSMLVAGHATTVMGIIIACIISFIILVLLVPGFFHSGVAGKVLADNTPMNVRGNTNGLSFMVFADAVFGNISAGSFISIILAFTVKRDQTRESSTLKERHL
jgi:hypothetical protein